MRRNIIIAGIVLILVITLLLAYRLNIDMDEQGGLNRRELIINLGNIQYPIADEIEIESYYMDYTCLTRLKRTVKKFNNVMIIKRKHVKMISKKEEEYIGSLGLSGNTPTMILRSKENGILLVMNGENTCSEDIIAYNLCRTLENKPDICSTLDVGEIQSRPIEIEESESECYKCCNILYLDDNIISRHLCGPTCGFVPGYIDGVSSTITRQCHASSCRENEGDKACCTPKSCVNEKECYNEFELSDVGNDERKEICFNFDENTSMWIDPDQDEGACRNNNLRWFEASSKKDQSFFGFLSKREGFCCGDDKKEAVTGCQGISCKTGDIACCNKKQCVYNGRCYPSGCNDVEINSSQVKLYCDGDSNRWYDLDDDYCQKCLGEDSWTGSECCGDDPGEGGYSNNFMVSRNGSKVNMGFAQCSKSRSDCVYPHIDESFKEGCYSLVNFGEYLEGSYYCKGGVWYDSDISRGYCERCGLDWVDVKGEYCCGDDKNEHYTKGEDGTDACCSSKGSTVTNNTCKGGFGCGDNKLYEEEECEIPESSNNKYCNQIKQNCKARKSGSRDGYGNCGPDCNCIEDEFRYRCVKGECGAECNQDGTGCWDGEKCDILNCECKKELKEDLKSDKNKVDINCPYRVDVNLDKEEYHVGETANVTVRIWGTDKKLMPSLKFFLEFHIDKEIKTMDLRSTDKDGTYRIRKSITNSTKSGTYRYVARVYYKKCEVIGDSAEAEFIIPRQKKSYQSTKVNKPRRKKTFNLTDFKPPIIIQEGYCGDGTINIGEVCEGSRICRNSLGCDYNNHAYDFIEYCSECGCPNDKWSGSNGEDYCSNCDHCGDGIVNCNEECESYETKRNLECEDGNIYSENKLCLGCRWYSKGEDSRVLVDSCWCDCPSQPRENCIDGNFVKYNEDYNSGCLGDGCNECSCEDTYTKDSNNDGFEDKCSPEICNNNYDDNDNGLVDEEECIWYFCSDCGHDAFNLCDKKECLAYEERCFFESSIFNYGFCSGCSIMASCEDYIHNKDNCMEDPCNLGGCFWNNNKCCTDSDNDGVCNYFDNCPEDSNREQWDYDRDGAGDVCDICKNESSLTLPLGKNESECWDGIDEDCDGLVDCSDWDCWNVCLNKSLILGNNSYYDYMNNLSDYPSNHSFRFPSNYSNYNLKNYSIVQNYSKNYPVNYSDDYAGIGSAGRKSNFTGT